MTRWKAALVHLGISAMIAALVTTLMLTLWYPRPYFQAMGGALLIELLVGCDVVIGPLITLIIFRQGKKGLKFDLAVIGCIQFAALAYGSYTMFIARPVFTIFSVDRFEVVAATDVRPEELAKGPTPDFSTLSLTGPRLAGSRPPEDPAERMRIAVAALSGGDDIKNLPRYYVPYSEVAHDAASKAKPLSILLDHNKASAETIQAFVARSGKDVEQLGYLPLAARNQSMATILDKRSGNVIGFLPLNPW
jgi:hypothetical protein